MQLRRVERRHRSTTLKPLAHESGPTERRFQVEPKVECSPLEHRIGRSDTGLDVGSIDQEHLMTSAHQAECKRNRKSVLGTNGTGDDGDRGDLASLPFSEPKSIRDGSQP